MNYFAPGLALACALFCHNLAAQAFAPKTAGVSGDLFLGAIYLSQTSNQSANDDADPLLTDFAAGPEATTRSLPAIIGNVAYTFEGLEHQLYAGVSRSNAAQGRFAGEFGYRRFLQSGAVFEAAYIPSLLPEEVWEDPYLLNQSRAETDQQLHAVRAKLERIAGTGLGIEVGYGQLDVKRERSGSDLSAQDQALLQRDGEYGYLGVEFLLPLARATFFTPSLYTFDRNAEGKANSYNAYGAELRLFHRTGRHSFIANLGYEQYRFDAVHPVFDARRDDGRWKMFASYLLAQPFGWESTSFTVIASMNDRDSDVDFFDESGLFAGAGFTYAF